MRDMQMTTLTDHPANTDVCPPECNPGPSGYIAWHEWAENASKTHRQKKCKVCKLYTVWVPK